MTENCTELNKILNVISDLMCVVFMREKCSLAWILLRDKVVFFCQLNLYIDVPQRIGNEAVVTDGGTLTPDATF